MRNPADEKLMAYVDGELNSSERADIEAAMQADPALANRIEIFGQTSGLLSGVFDAPMYRPVPDRLIDQILPGSGRAKDTTTPVDDRAAGGRFTDFLQNRLPAGGTAYRAAMAHGLDLLAGGALGRQLNSINRDHAGGNDMLAKYQHGQLKAHGRLNLALDSNISGQKLVWSYNTKADSWVKPVFTFRSSDNSYCRQYELKLSSGDGFSGIACRNGDGSWQIKVLAVAQPVSVTGNEKIAAAQADTRTIDKIVDHLIEGEVLAIEEEAVIIGGKWKECNSSALSGH